MGAPKSVCFCINGNEGPVPVITVKNGIASACCASLTNRAGIFP
jgi:hypothetical protein